MTPEQRMAQLEQRILILEQENHMFRIGRTYQFNRDLNIHDKYNVTLGTGTGTKFGTSATQKLGFYGKTPIVQYGAISTPSGGTVIDTQSRSAISLILTALRDLGLIAT